MKQKLTDLTGDGKITRKDFLRGAGVKGFSNGKSVRVPMEPDQETLDLIEQEIRETGSSKTQERIEAIMAGEQDGPAIDVRETRKPKTKKERTGETEITTDLLSKEAQEELKFFNKMIAKDKEPARKKFEKKVQEKMGSFASGGEVRGHKVSQVKGRNFSGTY